MLFAESLVAAGQGPQREPGRDERLVGPLRIRTAGRARGDQLPVARIPQNGAQFS